MKFRSRYLISIICLFLISCNEIIEFSPYDADVTKNDLNQGQIEKIQNLSIKDTLTIALFSDSHYFYDELAHAVNSINKQGGVDFVIACGDITDSGLAQEYECFYKMVKNFHYPLVTVIGNHDQLASGKKTYMKMFGNTDFSFECGNYKFIAFNSVIWENHNENPKFDWINQEIENSSKKCILLSHIPIWDSEYTPEVKTNFEKVASHDQVMLSLHGHHHHFRDTMVYNNRSIVTEAVFEREYYLIHLFGDNINLEKINF